MTVSTYRDAVNEKRRAFTPVGFTASFIPDMLFQFQRDCVAWAVRKGRAALFQDCGLGKSLQQIAWAQNVSVATGGNVLIVAPLAVAEQTVREAAKIGVVIRHVRVPADVQGGISITNYERVERFLEMPWSGIVLDESSILKSQSGKYRTALIDGTRNIHYRLCCTATPAPNDHMEIGNHAEFLGVMSRAEMLATFFVHDGGDTSEWRLKGHAEDEFWKWMASWAVMIRKPSDIGYSDDGFDLPELTTEFHHSDFEYQEAGALFPSPVVTLDAQRKIRRESSQHRVDALAAIVNASSEQWVVWCEMNDAGDALEAAINGAVQVAGADSEEDKIDRMLGFSEGRYRVLITKPKIAGFGMNWQNCHNVAFAGVTHSYEQYYQAVRRCWRFGQALPVNVHIVCNPADHSIVANLQRKQDQADKMATGMVRHMASITAAEIRGSQPSEVEYRTNTVSGKEWTMHLGDCVETVASLPNESVHFSIFSPPFSSLYTYSNSPFDMGNCSGDAEFFRQFEFLIAQLHRVLMPGRLVSFHCMNLPTSKQNDGFIGIRDFRGELIRRFSDAGFIFHSEVCIWKDPVTSMQRTKALGLLHKTIRKDSSMSRQGIPDYLVTMRKRGDNPEPIPHTSEQFPVSLWQRYASPVWMDINPSNTLQKTSAREEKDERHIAPLQLEVIERAIDLWTNPGDLVLSPFAGTGSEGYVAVSRGRRFIGVELKRSYFDQAVKNLARAEVMGHNQTQLFDGDASCTPPPTAPP